MRSICLLGILFLSSLLNAQQTPPVERFLFDEEVHDFGTVIEGRDAVWRYTFKNIGKDTITLNSNVVKPGCGCTASTYTKTDILPGDTGSITATFHSTGKVGKQTKNISVMFKGSVKVLSFKVMVVPPDTEKYTDDQKKKSPTFSAEKYSHDFGVVTKGQKVSTSITITNTGKDSLRIESAVSVCACINYKLTAAPKKKKPAVEVTAIAPGKSAKLELTYGPMHTGKSSDVITLFTNDVKEKRKAIRLYAEVK